VPGRKNFLHLLEDSEEATKRAQEKAFERIRILEEDFAKARYIYHPLVFCLSFLTGQVIIFVQKVLFDKLGYLWVCNTFSSWIVKLRARTQTILAKEIKCGKRSI
jgi:hypothetical protein